MCPHHSHIICIRNIVHHQCQSFGIRELCCTCCIMLVMRNTFLVVGLYCALHFACDRCENAEDTNTGWLPSVMFASKNISNAEILRIPENEDNNEYEGKISSRALLNDFGTNDAFDYERNQLKATPYYHPTSTRDNNYAHLQINTKPAASPSDAIQAVLPNSGPYHYFQPSTPYQTLQAPVVATVYTQNQGQNYHYPVPAPIHQYLPPVPTTPAPQYLPPVSAPSAQYLPPHQTISAPSAQYLPPHLEVFEGFPITNQTTNTLETNTDNLLYIQPGKCSNSIEVGRIRDVEVKTVGFKYNADVQKGLCVLMLYAHDESNKLAISLQLAQGSTNLIPTGSWLETNVKMYALQAGKIQPVLTTSNFGPGSPALILTKSNIVILSFFIDRAVDFFVDISTYQSQNC